MSKGMQLFLCMKLIRLAGRCNNYQMAIWPLLEGYWNLETEKDCHNSRWCGEATPGELHVVEDP